MRAEIVSRSLTRSGPPGLMLMDLRIHQDPGPPVLSLQCFVGIPLIGYLYDLLREQSVRALLDNMYLTVQMLTAVQVVLKLLEIIAGTDILLGVSVSRPEHISNQKAPSPRET